MADSLAARRLVREHLETHFEEYLSSVASYLQQAYPEFQLSNEVSEEMAATVIVRVSHANPEPTNIEKALTDSADEVIRSRRPRLSQAKLLDEVNGPLRSEFPRVLPSLRLIQRLSRAPVNGDGETKNLGVGMGNRLLLANPPLDLGVSIGLGGAATSEPEPAFGNGETNTELGRQKLEGGARRAGLSPDEARRLDEDEGEDDPFDLDSRPTITRVVSDQAPAWGTSSTPRFEGVHGPSARALTAATVAANDAAPESEAGWGHARKDGDDEITGARASTVQSKEEPPAALALGAPNLLVLRTLDEPSDRFEVPSLRQEEFVNVPSVGLTRPGEERSALGPEKLSSVPPTQESIIPGILPEGDWGAPGLEAQPSGLEKPRTRRKAASRAKKPAANRRPAGKTAAAKPRKTAARATKKAAVKAKAPVGAAKDAREAARQYVSDDLAVVAMMGFPTNPKRAAKLCVTAMAEDLGLDEHTDLSDYAAVVAEALEALRAAWTSQVPPDAHLEWQKVARQATLRAFLATRA